METRSCGSTCDESLMMRVVSVLCASWHWQHLAKPGSAGRCGESPAMPGTRPSASHRELEESTPTRSRTRSRFDVASLQLTGEVVSVDVRHDPVSDDEIAVHVGELIVVFSRADRRMVRAASRVDRRSRLTRRHPRRLVARNARNEIGVVPRDGPRRPGAAVAPAVTRVDAVRAVRSGSFAKRPRSRDRPSLALRDRVGPTVTASPDNGPTGLVSFPRTTARPACLDASAAESACLSSQLRSTVRGRRRARARPRRDRVAGRHAQSLRSPLLRDAARSIRRVVAFPPPAVGTARSARSPSRRATAFAPRTDHAWRGAAWRGVAERGGRAGRGEAGHGRRSRTRRSARERKASRSPRGACAQARPPTDSRPPPPPPGPFGARRALPPWRG